MADKPTGFDGSVDPVVEAYKKNVDKMLLVESLKLTVEQRIDRLEPTQFGRLLQILLDGTSSSFRWVASQPPFTARFVSHRTSTLCIAAPPRTSPGSSRRDPPPALSAWRAGEPSFEWSVETVKSGLNFTLVCTLGWIDLLGEVTGGGRFESLRSNAVSVQYHEHEVLCVSLPTLIALKRAAGRPKDNEVLAELESIPELQRDDKPSQ